MKLVYIIRWSGAITFPSGEKSNMLCMYCTREEAEETADRIAKENNLAVEAIV